MKKLIIAAMASTAFIATPALADPDDTDQFQITANIAQECSLQNPQAVNLGTLVIDEEPGENALTLDQNRSSDQQVFASCNYGATIGLASTNGGLLNSTANDGPDAEDFTNRLNYRLLMIPSDGEAFARAEMRTVDSGTARDDETQTDAFHDNATLRVRVLQSENQLRPLSGSYTDTAIVSLGAI